MILFVGSNPSVRNTSNEVPFSGTKSGKTLDRWVTLLSTRIQSRLGYIPPHSVTNVSHKPTKKNRALKVSEYDLVSLRKACSNKDVKVIVALGETASKALYKINMDHFKLPHPSPLNRVLNDTGYVRYRLNFCLGYIYEKLR